LFDALPREWFAEILSFAVSQGAPLQGMGIPRRSLGTRDEGVRGRE